MGMSLPWMWHTIIMSIITETTMATFVETAAGGTTAAGTAAAGTAAAGTTAAKTIPAQGTESYENALAL